MLFGATTARRAFDGDHPTAVLAGGSVLTSVALLRDVYWPKENPPSLLDATWKPPPVMLSK
jgi:hypothetical protein